MANTMRWRYGDTNPVMSAVEEETEIEIGDLLLVENNAAAPASALIDQGTEALNQHAFLDNFLGVAMQASRSGSTAAIRVATTGVFEFDTPGTAFELGDRIGPIEDASGSRLENQTVDRVLSTGAAIGRCAKQVTSGGSRVLVDIVSTVMRGGPQNAA